MSLFQYKIKGVVVQNFGGFHKRMNKDPVPCTYVRYPDLVQVPAQLCVCLHIKTAVRISKVRHSLEYSQTTEHILEQLKSFIRIRLLDIFWNYSPKPFFVYDFNPNNIKTIFIPSNAVRRTIIKARNSSPVHQSSHNSRPSSLTYLKCTPTTFN